MAAALLLIARKYWQQIALVVAVLAAVTWIAHAIYSRGVADTESKYQQATTGQLQERNTTNEDVRKFSESRKCRSLGGVYRNDRCE